MLEFDRGMPTETERFTVLEVARQVASQMVPINANFSFFSTTPIVDEDLRQYVHEPVAAVPPALMKILPRVGLLLVPFLEESPGRSPALVAFDRPEPARSLAASEVFVDERPTIAISTSGIDMSEYHYTFYDAISSLVVRRAPASLVTGFAELLREEIDNHVHGEVARKAGRPNKSTFTALRATASGNRPFGRPIWSNPSAIRSRFSCTASAAISTWKRVRGSSPAAISGKGWSFAKPSSRSRKVMPFSRSRFGSGSSTVP